MAIVEDRVRPLSVKVMHKLSGDYTFVRTFTTALESGSDPSSNIQTRLATMRDKNARQATAH